LIQLVVLDESRNERSARRYRLNRGRRARGPGVMRAPDASAEAFELDDLAVVDEQVDVDAVVLDVPGEDLRLGRLEHHVFEPEFRHDVSDDVGAASAVTGALEGRRRCWRTRRPDRRKHRSEAADRHVEAGGVEAMHLGVA
jgi:hypothetical protein